MNSENIKVGDKIRSWDFQPMEDPKEKLRRPDRYIEGEVIGETNDGRWEVHVHLDFCAGEVTGDYSRTGQVILTPKHGFTFEFENRLEILDA